MQRLPADRLAGEQNAPGRDDDQSGHSTGKTPVDGLTVQSAGRRSAGLTVASSQPNGYGTLDVQDIN